MATQRFSNDGSNHVLPAICPSPPTMPKPYSPSQFRAIPEPTHSRHITLPIPGRETRWFARRHRGDSTFRAQFGFDDAAVILCWEPGGLRFVGRRKYVCRRIRDRMKLRRQLAGLVAFCAMRGEPGDT